MKRFASFFAGIGGFDLAFLAAGWKQVFACENDPHCRKVWERRFGHEPEQADITFLDPATIPDADLWVAGPPCQNLSIAGKRSGLDGERSGLYFRFLHLVRACRPPVVLLEQVPGLFSSNEGRDMEAWIGKLAELGYVGSYRVLDALHLGVPQRRRRVFTLGGLGTRRAGEILSVLQGGAGDSQESQEARQVDPTQIARCVGGVGGGQDPAAGKGTIVAFGQGGGEEQGEGSGDDDGAVAPTVTNRQHKGGFTDPANDGLVAVGGEDPEEAGAGEEAGEPTAYHRNADCRVTDQKGKAAALRAEGEHSYQILHVPDHAHSVTASKGHHGHSSPLSSGSSQKSNKPGRRREDDQNLVVDGKDHSPSIGGGPDGAGRIHQDCGNYVLSPEKEDAPVSFNNQNNAKPYTGTLVGGQSGGGKNDVNHPLVFSPRHYTRPPAGGKPSPNAELTDAKRGGDARPHVIINEASASPLSSLTYQGFIGILSSYVKAQKAGPDEILSLLQEATTSEEGARRGLGVLAAFLPKEVLRQNMLCEGAHREIQIRRQAPSGQMEGKEKESRRSVRNVRKEYKDGCSPHRRESTQQQRPESDPYMQKLSSEATQWKQAQAFLQNLRASEQGTRLLRQALSAIQEVGRPSGLQAKSTHTSDKTAGMRRSGYGVTEEREYRVRRLTPT